MSAANASATPDWTTGPAKWAAVIVLGVSSMAGMAWSVWRASPTASPPAPLPPLQTVAEPTETPAPVASPKKININAATASELELLPGVGPAVAQRIIDHRTANGPFKRIEDLDQVRGIGPRTIEKLRPVVSVE